MRNRKTVLIFIAILVSALCLSGCNQEKETPSSMPLSGQASSTSEVSSINAEEKLVRVSVVVSETDIRSYEIATTAATLREAMEAEVKIEGTESEFGLFVTSVDGVSADESKQEWWCLTKEGEMWNYGIDSTEIEDGDVFELTLTTGY